MVPSHTVQKQIENKKEIMCLSLYILDHNKMMSRYMFYYHR